MKVLFIGNSHTYFNDMPKLFSDMCESLSGERAEVTMLAYSNRTIAWHEKEYFSIRFALLYGGYDYCVIQQFGHPMPPREETEPVFDRLAGLCRRVGTEPVLFMTWAKKDEPEKAEEIGALYRALAEKHRVPLAPIAELYEDIRTAHPEIELYRHDGSHASPYGTYLIAATFAALLNRSRGLNRLSDLSNDFRVRFRENELPSACEDAASVPVRLDPDKAKAIRNAVERAILGTSGERDEA